jgi:hypothetical protein
MWWKIFDVTDIDAFRFVPKVRRVGLPCEAVDFYGIGAGAAKRLQAQAHPANTREEINETEGIALVMP